MFALILSAALTQTPATWESIDKLIDESKMESALASVGTRLKAASTDEELARALITRARLRIQTGATETAIEELRTATWPKKSVEKALVNVFFAQLLESHLANYGWEINQREKMLSEKKDLKQWTRAEFVASIAGAWNEAFALRNELDVPLKSFTRYIQSNDFPEGVRSTLRDFISLSRARFYGTAASWTQDEQTEVYRLSVESLLADQVTSVESHPLVAGIKSLADLEQWHLKNQRREGALFARTTRLMLLHSAFTGESARAKIETNLKSRINSDSAFALSSWSRAEYANLLMSENRPVEARDVAKAGQLAFPESVGGKMCANMVLQLEAPAFDVSHPLTDGANKKTINVNSKNLKELFIKLVRIAPESMWRKQGYQVLPDGEFMKAQLKKNPEAQFKVELPETPDLNMHKTQVQLPDLKPGVFVVISSAREDFKDEKNKITGSTLIISDLIINALVPQGLGPISVVVRNGANGSPVNGASVSVYQYAWNSAPHVIAEVTTDATGFATVKDGLSQNQQYFVTAKKGNDFAVDANGFSRWSMGAQRPEDSSFVYTDRAIYRPGQKLMFKVVAYVANYAKVDHRVKPKATFKVRLTDSNGEEVGSQMVTTNDFGSASGSFVIPAGKKLGNWYLQAHGGGASIQVEEYKRPTFEVSFEDSKTNNRLNAPVKLKGLAKSYFGLPVSSGKVRWKVTRQPEWPRWCWFYNPPRSTTLVAGGTSPLNAQGNFDVEFLPEVNPALPKYVNYSYLIEAEVTDERGETRKAQKNFRLGLVGVDSQIEVANVQKAKEKFSLVLKRTSLDGEGRVGSGMYKVLTLKQPAVPVLAADEAASISPFEKIQPLTAGDKLKGRGASQNDALTQMRSWADGELVSSGTVQHAADGIAKVELTLPAGAYRVKHETKDEAGGLAESSTEFVSIGAQMTLAVPLFASLQKDEVEVGDTAKLQLHSGFEGQQILVEILRENNVIERKWVTARKDVQVIEHKALPTEKGGFHFRVSMVRDWTMISSQHFVRVPYSEKELSVSFATFRDTLKPGSKETFKALVTRQGKALESKSAEVLAVMYDQSLDALAAHSFPQVSGLYPDKQMWLSMSDNLHGGWPQQLSVTEWFAFPAYATFQEDSLVGFYGAGMGMAGEGFGGGGRGNGMMRMERRKTSPSEPEPEMAKADMSAAPAALTVAPPPPAAPPSVSRGQQSPVQNAQKPPVAMRENFAETALFAPHLLIGEKGEVGFEVQLPDSVTAWNVSVNALTKDLAGGSVTKLTRTVKELQVRPTMPRFLREGDVADMTVSIDNTSNEPMKGTVQFEILDAETLKDVSDKFGLQKIQLKREFSVPKKDSRVVIFGLNTPKILRDVIVKVIATSGKYSDGEQRALPILPSRMRLSESRFVTLKGASKRELNFESLTKQNDATRETDAFVVTVDGQLFNGLVSAVPYMQTYPYEGAEQVMNRFVTTGILNRIALETPSIAEMMRAMSKRKTPLKAFDEENPNRSVRFEETPWLEVSRGGKENPESELLNMLDPQVIAMTQEKALAKLAKMQLPNGGFPWFPGGPPSEDVTITVLTGLAHALEFGVDVPPQMVSNGFRFVANDIRKELQECLALKNCSSYRFVSIVHALSSFPAQYSEGSFTADEKTKMLTVAFANWKVMSAGMKGLLSMALQRNARKADAKLVFDSVMDSAKSTPDEGMFWMPEERSWLWYNDTVEGHAFALRALLELSPKDARAEQLVQWLFLNKKLGHWKSTRATAEAIYSVAKYLKQEKLLGTPEIVDVQLANQKATFEFAAKEEITSKRVTWSPPTATSSTVQVGKKTLGMAFASATWSFSTDILPSAGSGDLLQVERQYFLRARNGNQMTLVPVAVGTAVNVGDEIEVHVSMRAKHPCDYVHLRDPRASGFEPESNTSTYRYQTGLSYFEEVRDSATNFFFESVPQGQFTFKYSIRASMSGSFRVGPATLQSLYAPEFSAYSAGQVLNVLK
jgi:alpha-2-macroglobulin